MRPLILNYTTKQSKSQENKFRYNHELALSVVEIRNSIIPAIDLDSHTLSLETFTKVQGEGSDDNMNYCITTETRVAREDSDSCIDLMLATKTFSNIESDDECTYNN